MDQSLPQQRLVLSLMTHPVFARVESQKDTHLTAAEDTVRELFAARGAADPALEEVMLRSVLGGVIFKATVYADGYPLERMRRRLHEMYDLPAPDHALLDEDPPSVGRLRARTNPPEDK
ncbi:hypothetical protein [Actinophytocola oryzae]|uniref:Uncharacterized protein n=1 Tax=Actinophytocola oryzae TaxID=502181 RepID=A0A4V3FQL1_9PSEU|nr:hypothetical protein [Actinophytocola oryzae]TDV40091.1 hypothetical protein CLV71_124108 [Actinophytocola oryzae]